MNIVTIINDERAVVTTAPDLSYLPICMAENAEECMRILEKEYSDVGITKAPYKYYVDGRLTVKGEYRFQHFSEIGWQWVTYDEWDLE